ncbi:tRNA 2-thiouridine(34) synthase MnmA [Actinomycetaceae bacterium WB03_NA08]|uniref:tRNA-specific 2-thiouridylase MnmA n=1 Tax=Scrofimicrobium canadense TaxID=2652290 RepID=A0A6N7VUV0_9ACTO|nr:tRNA 2-thiouridine(34) synthase MnmA [Scrofimicrobium canadense]MSS84760.1 tRNA 2-thiouridine(34) synthase MnmA [Scrofimicrobium canadense]
MKVLAALSGGVDSAVAAALAQEAGHDVTAVHMALSANPASCRIGNRGCCSAEDAVDAARAAEIMGIPFYVWDLAEEFEETVIDDFLSEYSVGHTPNPCVRCNEFVKFRELADRARALGFDAVCTGHYAKRIDGAGGPELHRAEHFEKDQSYVLAVMGNEELSRVLLPLGDAPTKDWVRQQAEERGLGVSNKPDSYDICFIPDGDTQGFLRSRLGEKPGEIVDVEGNVVGEHSGYYQFTIGQRKGLNLGRPAPDGQPRYVVETKPDTNQVVVGAASLLSVDIIDGSDVVWLVDPRDIGEENLGVQMRAHGATSPVASWEVTAQGLRVHLDEAARGIAAGQSLVLYRGTQVVAQATICSTGKTRAAERVN